jgi:fatty acid desaturase
MTTVRANVQTGSQLGRLDPKFLVPSSVHGWCESVGNIVVFLSVVFLASFAENAWQYALAYIASGVALHRLFFPVHDCLHYSLFPTRSMNRTVGTLIAAIMGTSFDAIRTQHMEHHREFAHSEDPGAADYYVHFYSRWQLIWFLVKPLVGGLILERGWGYLVRPQTVVRGGRSIPFVKRLLHYAVIIAVQAGIAAIVTRGFQWPELWRYPVFVVIPAVTVFLSMIRLRMFLEHGCLNYEVCDYFEGRRPTARTIYASWWERLLLVGSHFNYHHEHHLYPSVPGCRLPNLHRQLCSAGMHPEDIRQTYFQAFREIWRNLPWRRRRT